MLRSLPLVAVSDHNYLGNMNMAWPLIGQGCDRKPLLANPAFEDWAMLL